MSSLRRELSPEQRRAFVSSPGWFQLAVFVLVGLAAAIGIAQICLKHERVRALERHIEVMRDHGFGCEHEPQRAERMELRR
jgi:hypothetical protein